MEHWLILVRAAGDLVYLAAAMLALAAARTDRTDHDGGNDIKQ
jgi:hypothetical protein